MDFDFPEVLGFRPQQTTTFFRTLIVAEALHLKHLSQCNIAPLLSKSAVRAKPPRLLRFSHLIRYVYKTKQSPVFFLFWFTLRASHNTEHRVKILRDATHQNVQ